MMQKQVLKRKKRKDKNFFLDEDVTSESDIVIMDRETLEKKLMEIFKNHIGFERAVTPVELITKIYKIKYSRETYYKFIALWEDVKKVLRLMGSQQLLMVVYRQHKAFVLKTEEELEYSKMMIDARIQGLRNRKKYEKEWVKKQLWRKL